MNNQHPTNRTFILYARKSSEGEDRQVQSIPDQMKHLLAVAKANNIKVLRTISEAKSAKKPNNRPEFSEMLKQIERGEASGILCWKLDRLARNPVDAGSITWMLQTGLISEIRTIDRTFNPLDNVLMMSVEFGMANQYIIDLRRNARRGMESKADKGWMPSRAPLGYQNDKENHVIRVDKKRFPIVRRMWDLMLTEAYTPRQICNIAVTQWGLKTTKHKRSGDNPISLSMVYSMFNKPFYYGVFTWGGNLFYLLL